MSSEDVRTLVGKVTADTSIETHEIFQWDGEVVISGQNSTTIIVNSQTQNRVKHGQQYLANRWINKIWINKLASLQTLIHKTEPKISSTSHWL